MLRMPIISMHAKVAVVCIESYAQFSLLVNIVFKLAVVVFLFIPFWIRFLVLINF